MLYADSTGSFFPGPGGGAFVPWFELFGHREFEKAAKVTAEETPEAALEVALAVSTVTPVGVSVRTAKVLSTTKGGKDLFRVVDDLELADIKKTGAFRVAPGQAEGKQFVDNFDDAQRLQKRFSDFFGGSQSIVSGRAPQSVLDRASRTPFGDIPKGTAITIPIKDLPNVKPKL